MWAEHPGDVDGEVFVFARALSFRRAVASVQVANVWSLPTGVKYLAKASARRSCRKSGGRELKFEDPKVANKSCPT